MTWPQLDNFKARLKEYQAREKKTQPQVAADLGTTYGTLRFWLSGARKPKLASLQNAARVFGCSVTEFIDDPNIPTVQGDFSHRSEKRRFLLGLIVKDMGVESITDENLEAIIQAAYRERDWILARKARQNSGKP